MIILKWSSKILTGSAFAVLLYSNAASAIGLGAITLKSVATQPLDAEIALTGVDGIDNNTLKVQLASPEAFEQAGVSQQDYLSQLDFSVTVNSANDAIVRLTSDKPLNQSSIDILVQLQSPSETLMRRYLLAMAEPTTTSSNRGKRQLDDNQHLVVVGDTLWNVSKRNRPRGLTILQTMDALYTQNPQAFVNGNANEMKEGAILRLPSTGDISQEAGDIVARQIGLVEELESQPVVLESTAEIEKPVDESIFLEADTSDSAEILITTEDTAEAAESSVIEQSEAIAEEQAPAIEVEQSKVAERLAAIDNELLSSEDEISKSELENNELRKRMALLEAEADTSAPSASETEQSQVDADTASMAENFTFADLQAQLERYPWYVWSGLAVIVLVLVMLLRRPTTKSSADEEEQEQPEAQILDDDLDYQQESSVDTGADLLVDSQDGLKLNPEDKLFDETDKEIFSEEDADVSPEIFDSMVEAGAEAEVYLSLGNVDQAINILQQAREADSNDSASRLKLMEILFREGRKDELNALFLEIELAGDDVITAMAADIIASEQKAEPTIVAQTADDS